MSKQLSELRLRETAKVLGAGTKARIQGMKAKLDKMKIKKRAANLKTNLSDAANKKFNRTIYGLKDRTTTTLTRLRDVTDPARRKEMIKGFKERSDKIGDRVKIKYTAEKEKIKNKVDDWTSKERMGAEKRASMKGMNESTSKKFLEERT